MDDILDMLNPRQRRAVTHTGGGLLVLAGAGTGKTRVLTSRLAWLIRENLADGGQILAVTFTNKAAREMQRRTDDLLAFHSRSVWLGTFHALCNRLLRMHGGQIGLDKNFQILDSQDQKAFIRRLLRDHDLDEDEFPLNDVKGYVNAAKDEGFRAANAPADTARRRQMAEIYTLYEDTCRRENKADFAELLLAALELLRQNDDLRHHYQNRFRHILADEFQDTNRLQFEWLKLLDSGDNCFFAVGDDDQSIYSFRGAAPGNMARLQKELRADTIVRLEENYRSTANIIAAANAVISRNRSRLGKTLTTGEKRGAPVYFAAAARDIEEAQQVAEVARKKIDGGVNPADIAVLYRTNAQSRLFEQKFVELDIPYKIFGGTRFFDRAEIKHALAYMQIAAADNRDALLRVINTPARGIGAKTLAMLTGENLSPTDLFLALQSFEHPKIAVFAALLQELRQIAAEEKLTVLARAAIEKSGLLAHYESRAAERERAENLRELVNAAAQFEKNFDSSEEENGALNTFLANAALESGGDETEDGGGKVNLMTVHAAKGLEFNAVFLVGLEEGLFPHAQSLDDDAAVEEERRLFYVALTRARRELFLSAARARMQFGESKINLPSRFLDELPPEVLESQTPRIASAAKKPAAARRGVAPTGENFGQEFRDEKFAGNKTDAGRDGEFRAGDALRHPKYGDGILLSRSGSGDKLQLTVTFKRFGNKTFMATLAPLQKIAR